MAGSVLVAGARTPIGKLSGALSSFRASDLGAIAIRDALRRAGIDPEAVEHVLMGQVIMAGAGQLPARQAAVAAGIPMTVPSTNINKVCLSGLNAIYQADQMIQSGDARVVVAGGMESMTNAPHLLPHSRAGFRYGNAELIDSVIHDALWCAFDACSMGEGTERYSDSETISRERQDEIAQQSHARAAAARIEGRLGEEIVSIEVAQRKGPPILVENDEGIRPETTRDSLAALRPAFASNGTITAGNSSQLSDGAAAAVVMSAAEAHDRKLAPLATIVSYAQIAGPSPSLLHQPSNAIRSALTKAGLGIKDLKLIEINEAFAAVSAASIADLGVSDDIVNVNGGAIALGHPVGMSGARIALSLAYELRRRGGGYGAAALCGGGGQGDAIIIRVD